jgi:hypothetical protein
MSGDELKEAQTKALDKTKARQKRSDSGVKRGRQQKKKTVVVESSDEDDDDEDDDDEEEYAQNFNDNGNDSEDDGPELNDSMTVDMTPVVAAGRKRKGSTEGSPAAKKVKKVTQVAPPRQGGRSQRQNRGQRMQGALKKLQKGSDVETTESDV